MMRRYAKATLIVCAIALAVSAGIEVAACGKQSEVDQQIAHSVVIEAAGSYQLTSQDMQMPELPTGCEATALSTLLRLNGVNASKTEVANAMPKSDTDFVHSFLGNPYSKDGGCCMSPCLAETARQFLVERSLMAYQTEGRELADLPMPCAVWVTIDLTDPQGPIKTQGAYEMYYPSHCVTVLGIDGSTVKTIDPLKGIADYPLDKFERVYEQLGAQAVYIGKE